MTKNAQTLLKELLDSLDSLGYRDANARDALIRRTDMLIRKILSPLRGSLTATANLT